MDQVDELNALVRDLLSLLALPALWAGRDARSIVKLLVEAFEAALPIDLAFGVTPGAAGEPDIEVLRIHGRDAPEALAELRPALTPHLRPRIPTGQTGTVVLPVIGSLRVVVCPMEFSGHGGALLVGSHAPDFPSSNHAVFLRAGTSLAASGLTAARALREREEANRAKDEFLAMLGHELRNPLAPIVTALQLMKLRGEAARELTLIEGQVRHLTTLVDDLLDIARVTRGTVELKREIIEIAPIIVKSVETASPLLEDRGHHLTLDVPASGLAVHADPTRLTQVLANLLTNAAKYTPKGGHIEVRAARGGDEVIVTVKDDGMGIPPDLLPRLFDLFVQGRTTIHRSEGGLGIGLALVRSLVGLHGGAVSARSEGAGRGSEFVVRLPASSQPAVARGSGREGEGSRAEAAAPALARASGGSGGRARIVVVDDNVDAGELLGEILREVGHEVEVVDDSLKALDLAETYRPAVMILDIGLPVMDGYELAGKIRERLGESAPCLVALTGYGQLQDRARSAHAGFARHLVKPVSIDEVIAAVEELSKRS